MTDIFNAEIGIERSVERPVTGQPVTLTVTLTARPQVSGVPDGEVIVSQYAKPTRHLLLDASGRATIQSTFVLPGQVLTFPASTSTTRIPHIGTRSVRRAFYLSNITS
jgi:hypothetical protein